jgi:sigma-B regulation protein RsbU (phosphoserine phosphatase)
MDPKDEEWGEEKLMAVLRAAQPQTAAEIVAKVMTEADAFAAGAKQHDDMTLIVLRAF